MVYTLFQNGHCFSGLLFAFKLALVASFLNSKYKKIFSLERGNSKQKNATMAAIWNKVYNEGERNTKYFHSLEKRHFNSETITNLFADDSTRISTDLEILQEAKNYYESLYTSITDKELSYEYNDIFFRENIEAKLTDEQKLSCEGELSAAECFGSLKTMEI